MTLHLSLCLCVSVLSHKGTSSVSETSDLACESEGVSLGSGNCRGHPGLCVAVILRASYREIIRLLSLERKCVVHTLGVTWVLTMLKSSPTKYKHVGTKGDRPSPGLGHWRGGGNTNLRQYAISGRTLQGSGSGSPPTAE